MSGCACLKGESGKLLMSLVEKEIEDPSGFIPEERLKKLKQELVDCANRPEAKSGRKLSAYQVYISECARKPEKGGRGRPFPECIEEWRKQKNG